MATDNGSINYKFEQNFLIMKNYLDEDDDGGKMLVYSTERKSLSSSFAAAQWRIAFTNWSHLYSLY